MTGAAQNQDPFTFAHAHRDEVVWMSQNTNQLVRPPAVEKALAESVRNGEWALYPPLAGIPGILDLVKTDLAVRPDDGFKGVVTSGALEALYALNRAVLAPGDEVIGTDPSFLPIHQQIGLSKARTIELPIYGDPWKLTVEQAQEAVTDKTRMLLLIDPINPLGTQYERAEVKAFADIANDHDLVLVHDVTYRDFARDPTPAHLFAPERTVYTYSFSKNCGLAGMRVGALVGPSAMMDRVNPFLIAKLGTNVLAQRAAHAALSTKKEWLPGVMKVARENERRVVECVSGYEGCHVPVTPSSTNTIIVDTTAADLDPAEIERRLLFEHKVFVRAGGYLSPRFGSRFVRISFTVPPAGVDRFCEAWPKVMAELGLQ